MKTYACAYCGERFTKGKTIIKHLERCEKKEKSMNHQGIDDFAVEPAEFEPGSGKLPRIKGPLFEDHCNHAPETYVASFDVVDFRRKEDGKKEYFVEYYDLYVFPNHGGMGVCMRYGNSGEDYLSPGGLVHFLQVASRIEHPNPPYERAMRILQEDGVFGWVKAPAAETGETNDD